MHVLIETVGSAGDVHPFVAVGRALVARGHDVVVFSNEHFRSTVEGAGLRFRSTGPAGDYEEITADPDLWHPTRGPRVVLGNTVANLLEPTLEALLEAASADTVIVSPTLGFAGRCAAEVAGLPLVRVHLQPAAFRSVHRAPRLPGMWLPPGAPAWWTRLLYRLADVAIDRIVCPRLNTVRAARGLPPARRVLDRWIHEADVLLALYPAWWAPPQPDTPRDLRHAGFVLFDGPEAALPADLAAWLAAGEPPVVFTHGSANRHGHRFFGVAARAARRLGRRALLVTSEPEAVAGLVGPDVRHSAYAPFGRVLPHAAAFVNHGGIGTVAQALAAGAPQVVVPMGFDQPDNAARVTWLGAGTSIPARRWSEAAAHDALRCVLADPALAETARRLSARLVPGAAAAAAATAVESARRQPPRFRARSSSQR